MSMRRSKLTASEAAILAGEIQKPSWQSKNEGIHERVSFEDSIWGFDLAGGSFYKTPLRVTFVKPESRAEKAGIKPGDKLLRINDIDTSTLTIQEAHEIIIESGVHIRLAVSAPDDFEDSYHCWQDQLANPYDSDEDRRKEEEKAKRRRVCCKTNSAWSLAWPWVSKRKIIYKESNCYMVPSKYEDKHRDKFGPQGTGLKAPEDIVLNKELLQSRTKREIIEEQVVEEEVSSDEGEKFINKSQNKAIQQKKDVKIADKYSKETNSSVEAERNTAVPNEILQPETVTNGEKIGENGVDTNNNEIVAHENGLDKQENDLFSQENEMDMQENGFENDDSENANKENEMDIQENLTGNEDSMNNVEEEEAKVTNSQENGTDENSEDAILDGILDDSERQDDLEAEDQILNEVLTSQSDVETT